MSKQFMIVSAPVDWSRKKLDMMRRDILVMLAREGAPNCEWIEKDFDPEAEKATEEKLYLHLGCGKCKVDFYAEFFEACPNGCGRESIAKVEPGRVPLPQQKPAETKPGKEASYRCDECAETWTATQLTPCPKCNSKVVKKLRAPRAAAKTKAEGKTRKEKA